MQTGQVNSRIVYDSCPLCRAREIQMILSADCSQHPLYKPAIPPKMTWMKCSPCGHVFTEGYFTQEALALIFSDANENQKAGFDIENQRFVSARMIEKVLPYAHDGYWLDIGFGNGSLLFTADEFGFKAVGVDLRKENVDLMKSIGFEAYCADVNVLEGSNRFSVVSMADVLEHMPYPGSSLESVYRLLRSDGVLLLSMPNMDSTLWKALDNNNANPYWGELEHYHNFGRTRLFGLLREKGFEPVRFGISERYRACMEIVARKAG